MIQVQARFEFEALFNWIYHDEDNTVSFTCNDRHYRLPNETCVVVTKCLIKPPTQSSTGG